MIPFYCPLEQFIIFKFLKLTLFDFFYITNFFISLTIVVFLILTSIFSVITEKFDFFLIPNKWFIFFRYLFQAPLQLLDQNTSFNNNGKYFPIFGSLFTFILFSNLFGLIPFTYTLTSQLILTLSLSLILFCGIQIIAIKRQGLRFFSNFFPNGISVVLSLLIIPIEFISFIFKPISLSVRLFINMLAGHILLKVAAGFGSIILASFNIFFFQNYTVLLILLFFMETAAAFIQAAVFTGLLCIYLNEAFNSH